MNEIPSYGSDLLFHQLLGKNLQNKYLICDTVFYINPSLLYKGVNIREINTYGLNEAQERVKWEKFADNHYLDKTFSSTAKTPNNIKPPNNIRIRNNKILNNIRRNKTTSFSHLLYNM